MYSSLVFHWIPILGLPKWVCFHIIWLLIWYSFWRGENGTMSSSFLIWLCIKMCVLLFTSLKKCLIYLYLFYKIKRCCNMFTVKNRQSILWVLLQNIISKWQITKIMLSVLFIYINIIRILWTSPSESKVQELKYVLRSNTQKQSNTEKQLYND